MCYFHVNAILSITTATRMIDRAGEVSAGSREEKRNVEICFFIYTKCIFLTPPTLKHTPMHTDKNETIYSSVAPQKTNRRPKT